VRGREVVVAIKAALTRGTDPKDRQARPPVFIKEVPSILGHEMAGVIAELGPGVKGYAAGQRVPVPPQFKRECPVSSPTFVVREDVVILDAGARLGHHFLHGFAPGLVVG
jgi:threonine dehydrogenase-like Zn-dependent dehydrogenase